MTPRQNDLLLLFLVSLQAVVAAVVLSDPADLGLSTTLVKWLVILNIPISLALNQMKALGAAGNGRSPLQQPPGTFADRPIPDPTLTRPGMPPPA